MLLLAARKAAVSEGGSTRTLRRETLLTPPSSPTVYVIGKINYTHRGGGGATASEIPPQSAAYLKSSRRRKLDSFSSLSLALSHPQCRSPTPTSGVGVCVYMCRCVPARVYISTSRADAAKPRAGVATAPKSSTDSLMVISHLCNLRHPSEPSFLYLRPPPPPSATRPAVLLSLLLPPSPIAFSSLLSLRAESRRSSGDVHQPEVGG